MNAISYEFADQIKGNTLTKIHFRCDVPSEVEEWASTIGTIDGTIYTHQVDQNLGGNIRTGVGSEHNVQTMKVDFNVFKNLKRGEAIIHDKGRNTIDVMTVWDGGLIEMKKARSSESKLNYKIRKVEEKYQKKIEQVNRNSKSVYSNLARGDTRIEIDRLKKKMNDEKFLVRGTVRRPPTSFRGWS